jgi:hypothetical protein
MNRQIDKECICIKGDIALVASWPAVGLRLALITVLAAQVPHSKDLAPQP